MSRQTRLARLEHLARGDERENGGVIILGGLPDCGPCDYASAPNGRTWQRGDTENVAEFQHRVRSAQRGAGGTIWGGLPE